MAKAGTEYEQVVADVLQAMSKGATVTQGEWVDGPDGRRDRDVFIDGQVAGVSIKVLVECKDWNPDTTGPVGIGEVDKLDSKRRDLGAHTAMICSSSGFTEDALNKCRRVGIGVISVLREDDERVRFTIRDDIYTRQIRLDEMRVGFQPDPGIKGWDVDVITCDGKPVYNWVTRRVTHMFGLNPIVNGGFEQQMEFADPVTFDYMGSEFEADAIYYKASISGRWLLQRVEINSTNGVYDWARHHLRLVGAGSISYSGFVLGEGDAVETPPDWLLEGFKDARPPIGIRLLHVLGLEIKGEAPDLTAMAVERDRVVVLDGLTDDYITSTDGFDPEEPADSG